jgi:type IV secretory pathway TraG/TraD family ATPase VirD4
MKQSPVPAFLFLAVLAALLIFFASGLLTWKVLHGLQQTGMTWPAWSWQAWKVWHWTAFIKAPLPLGVPAMLSLVSGGFVGWWASSTYEAHGADKHIRGRQLLEGAIAARRFRVVMRRECRAGGVGLQIHPAYPPINERREKEHFFLIGGPGSGKTQLLIPWITAARKRGDRCLIHDIKGDFTANLPHPKAIVFLAPWDERSEIWSVAEDVATKSAAREFAARLILDNKQSPMWPNAARQVLVGICVYLQSTKPLKWGFKDIAQVASSPWETLKQIMEQHNPEANRALESLNVTTIGILINLMSFLSPVFDLAAAWPTAPEVGQGFSMRRWLYEKDKRKSLVLQGSGEFAQLASGLNGALVGLASQIVSSPSLPDSNTRRVWFFLDEFVQLGKLETSAKLLELGRSKGVRVVIAVQTMDQLKAMYDNNFASGLLGQVGTMVVGRSQGETATHIAEKIIGEREIERAAESRTTGTGQQAGIFNPGGTLSASVHRHTEPVVMPAQLSALGADKTGVWLLWLLPEFALKLHFPFTPFPQRRKTSVPAAWTSWPQESRMPQPQQQELTDEHAVSVENTRDDEPGEQEPTALPPTSLPQQIEITESVIQQPVPDAAPLIVDKPILATATEAVADQAEDALADVAKGAVTEAMINPLDALLPGIGTALHLAEQVADLAQSVPAAPVEVLPQVAQQPQRRRFKRRSENELEDAI